jgi:hypothetical protein
MSRLKLFLIVSGLLNVCLLIVVLLLAFLYIGQQGQANITPTPTPTPQVTTTPLPVVTQDKFNAIMLCDFQGKKGLYFHNGSDRNYTSFLEVKTLSGSSDVAFSQLTNCIMVYQGKDMEELGLDGVLIDKAGTNLYIAFVRDTTNTYSYVDQGVLLKFNLHTGVAQEVLATKLGDDFENHGAKGAFFLPVMLNDMYLIFEVSNCYGCGASLNNSYFAMNTQTDTTIFLGMDVGGFTLTGGNKVSFKKLVVTGTVPGCQADDCNTYAATGTAGIVDLP